MTLKLLHTSDWHLGATLYGQGRGEEHALFLDWLVETLTSREIDLLIVAGDIFHQSTPSAEAQEAYFSFLARVARETQVRQIVVVAGNHDSAARIDAPAPVLDALRVHVVGEIVGEDLSRCLCPVVGPSGAVEVVVAAVPFVHEFRLGVRTTGKTPTQVHAELTERFRALYAELADLAQAQWPDARLVTTGHLTCVGARPGDYATELHMAGSVGALGPEVFDPRFCYVALGHIHRAYAVDVQGRVWYAGAPVPVRFDEADVAGEVLEVDLAEVAVQRLAVPRARRLVRLIGEPEELVERLERLRVEAPLAPFVHAEAVVERHIPGLGGRLLAAVERNPAQPSPMLLATLQTRARGMDDSEPAPEAARLRDLNPEQVFTALHRARRGTAPSAELLGLFRRVVSEASDGREARRAEPAPAEEASP